MKKRIIRSLCAAAVLAYASLSWGAQVYVETQAENLLLTPSTGNIISFSTTYSFTSDTATVNGTTVGTDNQVGPNASSQLGTIVTGNTMIQGNSGVVEGSPAIAPAAAGIDVYALAAGTVSIDPWANGNPLLPDHASLQSVATFRQDFTTSAAGNLVISGDFRHFWQGDATSSASSWQGVFTVLDVTGGTTVYQIDSGIVPFLAGDNANNNLAYLFSTGTFATLAGNNYAFITDAYITASDPVPEPSTFVLAGSGLLGLFFMRRRAKKA